MATYAYVNDKNKVTNVFIGREQTEVVDGITNWEEHYSTVTGQKCLLTSIEIRKNFAGIGFTYDEKLDAFIAPKPYKSWKLDKLSCQWTTPIPYPTDGLMYFWNEEVLDWEATQLEADN